MPAKSERQRKAMGAALALKRAGKRGPKGQPSEKLASSMDMSQLRDFAKKRKK